MSCRKCGSQSPEGGPGHRLWVVISCFSVERLFLIWSIDCLLSQHPPKPPFGNNIDPNMLNSEGTSIFSCPDEETESQSKLQGFLETGEGIKVKLHYLFSTPPRHISSLEPSLHTKMPFWLVPSSLPHYPYWKLEATALQLWHSLCAIRQVPFPPVDSSSLNYKTTMHVL